MPRPTTWWKWIQEWCFTLIVFERRHFTIAQSLTACEFLWPRYHLYGCLGVHCNSQSSSIFFFTRGKGRVANSGDCRKHEYFGDWLKWWCFYRPFSFKCFPTRHYLFEKDCKYITNGLIWCICLYESHQEHYRNESKRTFCNILISVKGSSNSK